jgi:RimJ/RimL family protein N-acetyltransferase
MKDIASVVTLRFPEPTDADAVFAAVRESIGDLHLWMSWCRIDYSIADAAQWISGQAEARKNGVAFEFVITDEQGRILGGCGVNQINKDARLANLGYWVRTSETGRGVATRAARDVAAWAFENTTIERLEIVVAVGNTASQVVAEKAGALREGILRSRLLVHGRFHDAVMFSLIRPQRKAG